MSKSTPCIKVTKGPLAGQRFEVPPAGLRMGRSSSCEVTVQDPALSRNHCLFEMRDGSVWVTDLASANGTTVNGALLGADSVELKAGDVVEAGETTLTVAAADEGAPAAVVPAAQAAQSPAETKVDLGLGRKDESGRAGGKPAPMRFVIWAVALLAVAGAAVVILSDGARPKPEPAAQPLQAKPPARLLALSFEKVEADKESVYRYALSMDQAGVMTVEIDDVPKENRHVRKTSQLPSNAVERLTAILSAPELYKLSPEYTGVPLVAGTLKSFSLKVVRGDKVFSTSIENAPEPNEFRAVREQLETFSKNELGIWAIQFSAEKLVEMSAEARRAADAKWEERDVQHGNLSSALASYDEAVFYLDTVNPKPAWHGELVNRRKQVADELDRRYRDQRFLADRAINLGDWPAARRELRVLCELVPDAKDPRHAEAAAKLLDVEARMRKK